MFFPQDPQGCPCCLCCLLLGVFCCFLTSPVLGDSSGGGDWGVLLKVRRYHSSPTGMLAQWWQRALGLLRISVWPEEGCLWSLFPYFPQASQRRQRQGKWEYFSVRKALRKEVWGWKVSESTPSCPPYLCPGRSEDDRVKNEYEDSQWTGDRDTRSSTVSGDILESSADRELQTNILLLTSG